MNAPLFALLLPALAPAPAPAPAPASAPPAAPPASAPDAVSEVPRVADANWSVGAAIGPGAVTADVEHRLGGRVWGSLNLAADTSRDEGTETVAAAGSATVTNDDVRSGWNVGAGTRFRLQLLPDDAFLRPSLFLGGGIAVAQQVRNVEQTDPSEPTQTSDRDAFTLSAEGNFGVLLDFTVLPWLALRAGSSLVHGGYRSTVSKEVLQEEGASTQTTSSTTGGFFGGVQLQPALGLQAFF